MPNKNYTGNTTRSSAYTHHLWRHINFSSFPTLAKSQEAVSQLGLEADEVTLKKPYTELDTGFRILNSASEQLNRCCPF